MVDDDAPGRARRVIDLEPGTRRDFAAAIGLDETKLSKSLAGRRRFAVEELVAIAERTGVTVPWLLHGRDDAATAVTALPGRDAVLGSPDDEPATSDRRRRILAAAWRQIADHGYHHVRVADVARASGSSSAAVHYHFPTKESLLGEALRYNVKLAFDRQAAALADIPDVRARLLHLLEIQSPHGPVLVREWSVWMQVWTEAVLDAGRRELYWQAQDRWYRTVLLTLQDGVRAGVFRDGDLALRARQVTGLVDGLGIGVLTRTPGADVEVMQRALREFVDRVVCRPQTSEEEEP